MKFLIIFSAVICVAFAQAPTLESGGGRRNRLADKIADFIVDRTEVEERKEGGSGERGGDRDGRMRGIPSLADGGRGGGRGRKSLDFRFIVALTEKEKCCLREKRICPTMLPTMINEFGEVLENYIKRKCRKHRRNSNERSSECGRRNRCSEIHLHRRIRNPFYFEISKIPHDLKCQLDANDLDEIIENSREMKQFIKRYGEDDIKDALKCLERRRG